MRIVQLANFHTPSSGGLRVALEQLRSRYAKRGCEVTLIVPGPTDDEITVGAITVVTLKASTVPGFGGYRMLLSKRRVADAVIRAQPDVIELSDKSSLHWVPAWACDRRIPVVLLSHERIDAILRSRLPGVVPLSFFADRWNRHLARHVDVVAGASCFAVEEYLRVGHRRVMRVPFGVDRTSFNPEQRFAGRDRGGVISLVVVGRLSGEKQPDLAIETTRELVTRGRQVRLAVVGDGPLRSSLERRSVGLPVDFVGHIADRDEVARIVANADIALAPCSAETFGLAALEAMACGTPIVVPQHGALPELVSLNCGMVAEANPMSFADAVDALWRGDPVTQRSAAARRASEFDWDGAAGRLLGVYQSLLRQSLVAS